MKLGPLGIYRARPPAPVPREHKGGIVVTFRGPRVLTRVDVDVWRPARLEKLRPLTATEPEPTSADLRPRVPTRWRDAAQLAEQFAFLRRRVEGTPPSVELDASDMKLAIQLSRAADQLREREPENDLAISIGRWMAANHLPTRWREPDEVADAIGRWIREASAVAERTEAAQLGDRLGELRVRVEAYAPDAELPDEVMTDAFRLLRDSRAFAKRYPHNPLVPVMHEWMRGFLTGE